MFRGRAVFFKNLFRSLNTNAREYQEVEFDWKFLTREENRCEIKQNIINRKGVGNIDEVNLHNKLAQLQPGTEEFKITKQNLMLQAFDIPNMTHPDVPVGSEDQAKIVSLHGLKKEFNFRPKQVKDLGNLNQKLLQTNNVAQFSGPRTYHLVREFADLECALVKYTFDYLLKQGFKIISVPDFVPSTDVEKCGFKTTGLRTQVYKVAPNLCLSGTGEMSLASYLTDKTFNLEELPLKLATVSRCFRAETSDMERERGLYRVHQFTKVEMFGVSACEQGNESNKFLEEFVRHQTHLFSRLGLHFRVLDMPTQELGAPAFRKYDIEAWLPAKEFWGEISSASNCTDYQSRRLNIRYMSDENIKFCHTINGTACAVPRMVISLAEANQQKDGSIILPNSLIPYMDNIKINSRIKPNDCCDDQNQPLVEK